MLKINADNLDKEIEKEIAELQNGFISSAFCIAEFNGIQIQITITKDEDEFCDRVIDGMAEVIDY